MKKLLALFLALIMVLSLVACGAKEEAPAAKEEAPAASEEKTEEKAEEKTEEKKEEAPAEEQEEIVLEYWSSWSESENQATVLKAAAESFMEKYPHIKINFTFNGRTNDALTLSAIEAGTKIDMMDANMDVIARLWSDNIKDISEYMDEVYDTTDGKPYNECVIPSTTQLASTLFGGQTKVVPYIPQAFMIFCNKNIFDEVGITEYPQTWEEFMDACAKIKDAGYIPISTDSAYGTSWMGYYLSRLIGNDRVAELVYDAEAFKAEPGVLEAAKAIEELATLGYFDPNIGSNVYPAAQQDMVISEQIAMYINGTWLPNEVAPTTADTYQWGAFAFPAVPNGVEGTEAGCYSAYGIAINKDCDDAATAAAFEFAVYVTTGEVDQALRDQANAIPMGIDAEWPENLADAKVVMNSYTKRYPAQTAIYINTESRTIIEEACVKLMAGTITAEEFVELAGGF